MTMTYEDYAPLATPGDAHREWHLNSGVPMGQPGCPQDACHLPDEGPYEEPTVKCGNKAAHGGQPGYHYTAAGVKECYASTGRFTFSPKPGQQVRLLSEQAPAPRQSITHAQAAEQALSLPTGVWHSTGPTAPEGHWEAQCPGDSCPVWALPAVSVDDAVAKMRAAMEAKEAEEAAAKRARYAAWRSIPVGNGDRANYALMREGSVVLYQIQRPSKGDHRGKTFVKRHSGEGLAKMGWVESGEVMDAIAADPMAAAVLYGRSSRKCAICHRQLTDDVTKGPDGLSSVERGIGPKCAQKVSI